MTQLKKAITEAGIDVFTLNHSFRKVPKERTYIYDLCKRSIVFCIVDMCVRAAVDLNNNEELFDHKSDARVFSFRKFVLVSFGGAVPLHQNLLKEQIDHVGSIFKQIVSDGGAS